MMGRPWGKDSSKDLGTTLRQIIYEGISLGSSSTDKRKAASRDSQNPFVWEEEGRKEKEGNTARSDKVQTLVLCCSLHIAARAVFPKVPI